MNIRHFSILAALFGASLPLHAKEVSYNHDIRPILSDKCFACHGPDIKKNDSGLRLDLSDSAYDKLKETEGYAIVPGKPEQSVLWHRITTKDKKEVMPPSDSHLKQLTANERDLIKRWIEQGAKYESHWAFLPIKLVTPPKIEGIKSTNPIDHFIARELKEFGWSISAPTDKSTLLRRVSYDLTGLPPTDAIAKAYLADAAPAAYEKLVDDLLASPRYGEHMAVNWLEASRYADTTGYQHDWTWHMYPWRTWVIRAMNSNLPFNDFLTWQLAGDMLPKPTPDQLVASAFNRLHRVNTEGGALTEEFQVENTIDRVETVSTAMLGLTMGCARCHDHKYDPISQKEFFSFYAFFNSTEDSATPGGFVSGVTAHPLLVIKDLGPGETTASAHVMISKELPKPRPTYLLERGDYLHPNKKLGIIPPGMPKALPSFAKHPKNRLGLAQWISSPENPLTSRVMVNRFWQQLFGTGIVATSEDFGLQGSVPSHPEMLDWLSRQWMDQKWDTKKLIRQIVTSETYRQGSKRKLETLERDPKNNLLSYFPRKRLSGYAIRDQALALSGLLHEHIGGRPARPYQPIGMWAETGSSDAAVRKSPLGTTVYRQDTGSQLYRRSIYTFWKRGSAPPTLSIFDAPNREICSVRHDTTNTPLQALALLNDVTYLESARLIAATAMLLPDSAQRLAHLGQHIIKRPLTGKEVALLNKALEQQLTYFKANPADAQKLLKQGQFPNPPGLDPIQQAAWMQVSLMFLNLDETITKP